MFLAGVAKYIVLSVGFVRAVATHIFKSALVVRASAVTVEVGPRLELGLADPTWVLAGFGDGFFHCDIWEAFFWGGR